MNLRGIERGGGRCRSGASVVGFRRAERTERKANYFGAYRSATTRSYAHWGKVFDLLQSLTPFAVRLFHVVCGQPAFLGAPVLKTVFRNPAGHFPPPDPAVELVGGCCACPEATVPGPAVDFEVLVECDSVPFTAWDFESPSGPLLQPGI